MPAKYPISFIKLHKKQIRVCDYGENDFSVMKEKWNNQKR